MHKTDRLIKLLDSEIERIRSDDQSPGWTTWALLAAVATIVSIFLTELDNNDPNWVHVFAVFLCMQVSMDILWLFFPRKEKDDRRQPIPRFEHTDSTIALARPLMCMFLIRLVFLIYLYFLLDSPRGILMAGFILWNGFLAAIVIGGLVLSAMRLPVPTRMSQSTRSKQILNLVVFGISLVALSASVQIIRSLHPLPTVFEVELAAIMSAALLLLALLVKRRKSSRMLPALYEIRRDLALDRIDYEAAANQADIALSGLRVTDVLQDLVAEILEKLGQLDELSVTASQEVEALAKAENESGADASVQNSAIKNALRDAIDRRFERAQKVLKQAAELAKRFSSQSSRLMRMVPESESEIEPLIKKFDKSIEEVKVRLRTIRSRLEELTKTASEISE